MKLICVDYPFQTDMGSKIYYPTMTEAKKDAFDLYVTQEEVEDMNANGDADPIKVSSRLPAKVYDVEVPVRKSLISALLNDDLVKTFTGEYLVSEFRYRRGKIVVSNAKVTTEPQG
jgi:hypothetical protein